MSADPSPATTSDAGASIARSRTVLSDAHQQALDEFVLLWGEMASHWGINRTMAQIHALLYASDEPLDTDEIMEHLQISRGNANMNLRALLDWNLVRKTHQLGSRKDYFVAEKDVWTFTTTIIEERQRREIKPVQRALGRVADDLRADDSPGATGSEFADRLDNLVAFIDTFDGFTSALLPLLKGRNAEKVQKLVAFASRLRSERD
ncbi:MAG: hypothetical protein AAF170_17700 [Bacteroidota bacterium]